MKLKMKGTLDPFITMALTTNIILLTTVGVLAIYAYITYPEIQWTEKSINNLVSEFNNKSLTKEYFPNYPNGKTIYENYSSKEFSELAIDF